MSLIIIVSEVKPSNIMEKDPKQTQEKLLCSSDTAPTIHSLPGDAVALVARHAPDLETLKNLAAASPLLRKTLFEENLLCCDHCHNALYSDDSLKQPAPHTQPFSCAVCRGKFCVSDCLIMLVAVASRKSVTDAAPSSASIAYRSTRPTSKWTGMGRKTIVPAVRRNTNLEWGVADERTKSYRQTTRL